MPSSHLILCHPLVLPASIFPSIRVFSNKLVLLNWWPNYRSFRVSLSPSNEYSGLISLRIDELDLLSVFSIRSYPLPSGGPVRNSKSTAGLHGSVCQRGHNQLPTLQSCYVSKPNSASLNVWGEPSSGNHCLDYDTIHHFPSAEFQRVKVESLRLALGPQQNIERR